MRKVLGLAGLLAGLILLACLWQKGHGGNVTFVTSGNVRNLLTWVGLFGILSLGQAFVIVTGGIDLSVGSIVALFGILAAHMLDRGEGLSPVAVLPVLLVLAVAIGGLHGLLVTKGRMQPFVVTLCGLFFYRGIARVVAGDKTCGFGMSYDTLTWLSSGFIPGKDGLIPVPFVIFLITAAICAAFLHLTPAGRHLFALGANEEAARFSGIRTERLKVLAYVLCTVISGLAGLLLSFNINSLGPTTHGSFYELYAIAGVVLGGFSLRGGSGNFIGVIIGAALIQVLKNLVNILEIPSQLEYMVIGGAILAGVFLDELFTRRAHRAAA